jgi:hypothetical protein
MNICQIEVEGKEYKLCLTRKSVKLVEALGFDLENFIKKPITYTEMLWVSSFTTYHDEMKNEDVASLMDKYREEGGDVEEVIEFLMQEYSAFAFAPTDTKSKKKAKITKA